MEKALVFDELASWRLEASGMLKSSAKAEMPKKSDEALCQSKGKGFVLGVC